MIVTTNSENYAGIAGAIRDCAGTQTQYRPGQMAAAVRALKKTLVPKTVTENGSYDPADDNADGYSAVTVDVSGGFAPNGGGGRCPRAEKSTVFRCDLLFGSMSWPCTAAEEAE